MTDDVRDLLRGAAPPPKRRIDVGATAGIAHARLRRRRLTIRAGAVAAIVVLAGVGVSAAFGGDGGRRVEIAAASQASNTDASVSVELPDGWQQLPLVERAMSPGEVLVVGTAIRPVAEPIQGCALDEHTPSTQSAYVTLYEYRAGDALNIVGDVGTYSPEAFQTRPADFASANMPASGDCANVPLETLLAEATPLTSASTTPDPSPDETASTTSTSFLLPPITGPDAAPVNHFRQITFTDGGRMFLARIISVQDPSEALLAQGFAVLNTLVVGGVEEATTTTTALPGFDEEAATQQIVDAINASFGTPSPTPSELSVEGGHPFADPAAAEAAAEKAKNSDPLTRESYEGSLEGKLVATINWIEFDSPTYARLNFDVFNDGQFATANTTGYAVFEDGFWRLGRGTFCEIAMRGGVDCV